MVYGGVSCPQTKPCDDNETSAPKVVSEKYYAMRMPLKSRQK